VKAPAIGEHSQLGGDLSDKRSSGSRVGPFGAAAGGECADLRCHEGKCGRGAPPGAGLLKSAPACLGATARAARTSAEGGEQEFSDRIYRMDRMQRLRIGDCGLRIGGGGQRRTVTVPQATADHSAMRSLKSQMDGTILFILLCCRKGDVSGGLCQKGAELVDEEGEEVGEGGQAAELEEGPFPGAGFSAGDGEGRHAGHGN